MSQKNPSMNDGTAVTRAVSAIDRNIKELVKLLGDPDDAVGNEAFVALQKFGPLSVEPLAAAISRPRSSAHRVRALVLVGIAEPIDSLPVQKALEKVAKKDPDPKVVQLARLIQSDLAMSAAEAMSRSEGGKGLEGVSRMTLLLELAQQIQAGPDPGESA